MGARSLVSCQTSAVIVGGSSATVRLRAEIDRIAPFSSNVLITGPSGTGKELVARQIHARSPRADQPFIPVDCASMSGELMSSQLFGHVAGAFTGANYDALGCFRAANRGTIFLDEIGELDISLQAKLLRVLQEHVVTPVGSHQGERIDVRVVAATNRNLQTDVFEGRFREDLYYRLDVVHLRTTALRERPGDICELADTFLAQLAHDGLPECSLTPAASAVIVEFPWPGNVRQLRNVLEQATIDSESSVITAERLQRIMSQSLGSAEFRHSSATTCDTMPGDSHEMGPRTCLADNVPQVQSQEWRSLNEVERDYIARTLAHTFNNRSAAARLLGITRQALLRKMKRYGIGND